MMVAMVKTGALGNPRLFKAKLRTAEREKPDL